MPLSYKIHMSKIELQKELKKVNVAIDKKILNNESYGDLAKRHSTIVKLLNQ